MSVVRRFLVAPSLVRLIRKERGGARITEGYFAPQGGRTSFVRVDGQQCQLVLVGKGADGAPSEERTEVPRAHGDALLDVCPGKAAYDRTALTVSGREVVIDRYVSPGSLDLVSVAFDSEGEADGFAAPAWFGPEVTADSAYERQAVALQGPPQQSGDIPLSNAALDAVLDLIEPRFGFGRYTGSAGAPRAPEPRPEGEDGVVNTLRRIAGGAPAAAPAAAVSEAPREQPSEAPTEASQASAPEAPQPTPPAAEKPATDARIDDVIESLSQALGAAIQQPQEPAPAAEDPAAAFERWTVRPRRTQPQN